MGSKSTKQDDYEIIQTSLKSIQVIKKSKLKIEITKTYVGRYATSMEMAGMSITVFKVNHELKNYLFAPTECPFWNN